MIKGCRSHTFIVQNRLDQKKQQETWDKFLINKKYGLEASQALRWDQTLKLGYRSLKVINQDIHLSVYLSPSRWGSPGRCDQTEGFICSVHIGARQRRKRGRGRGGHWRRKDGCGEEHHLKVAGQQQWGRKIWRGGQTWRWFLPYSGTRLCLMAFFTVIKVSQTCYENAKTHNEQIANTGCAQHTGNLIITVLPPSPSVFLWLALSDLAVLFAGNVSVHTHAHTHTNCIVHIYFQLVRAAAAQSIHFLCLSSWHELHVGQKAKWQQ